MKPGLDYFEKDTYVSLTVSELLNLAEIGNIGDFNPDVGLSVKVTGAALHINRCLCACMDYLFLLCIDGIDSFSSQDREYILNSSKVNEGKAYPYRITGRFDRDMCKVYFFELLVRSMLTDCTQVCLLILKCTPSTAGTAVILTTCIHV